MANVLLLGHGHRGQAWHRELGWQEHKVVGVVEPVDPPTSEEFTTYAKIEQVEWDSVDWVIDSSPTFSHFSNIQKVMATGKPMIVESPVVDSPETFYTLLGALGSGKQKVFVSQPHRYDQSLEGLLFHLREGETIERIHLEICRNKKVSGWLGDLSSPVVQAELICLIDTAQAIAGNLPFTEIHSVSPTANTVMCVGLIGGKIPVSLYASWESQNYSTSGRVSGCITTDLENYTSGHQGFVNSQGKGVPPFWRGSMTNAMITEFQKYLKSDNPKFPGSYVSHSGSMQSLFDVYMQLGLLNDRLV